ncbi:MAG TPA: hypothetical protein PLI27_00605 [Ignavibacteriales bacterium]|nr:hypothetical protein [Ignavibacteriales bacterium]HOL81169.1 hypothetical protein [Ignavibacteriales bacterium]HOM65272.1 hypothetical protein [Ignavibacteriales bacterium]HPD66564.1 hypothetical protein [Ignavibacteriales bacterium]HPP33475.1 hypothetical protein [Ignavibacteriales bacterium]
MAVYKDKQIEGFIEDLKNIAKENGITVRFEKGDFKGGFCILKDSRLIVINKNFDLKRKAVTLVRSIKEIGIDQNTYISPQLQQFIEDHIDENIDN